MSVALFLVVTLTMYAAVVFTAPAVDLLPSDAEFARLARRWAYNRGNNWGDNRDNNWGDNRGNWGDSRGARGELRDDAAAATPACVTACFKTNYYDHMPTGGYDKDPACKAMKASYNCAINAQGCVDATTATTYKQYVTGYEFWCPGT